MVIDNIIKDRNSLEHLVRAVWAAGFRAGKTSGGNEASAYEYGDHSYKPQGPDDAWKEDVQWRIDVELDSSYHIDMTDPGAWEDVP
jgi:hypothetical protein